MMNTFMDISVPCCIIETILLPGVVVTIPLTPVPEVTDMLYNKQSLYVACLYLS